MSFLVNKKLFFLLSLGSNIGKKKETIEEAIEVLASHELITELVVSSYYRTEPYGVKDQDWFVNVCLCGYTQLPVYGLLDFCQRIEKQFGRQQRERWHKRELDIDIIFSGNDKFDEKNLTIPHKEYKKRNFVLVPAAEIAGDFIPPDSKLNLKELSEQCTDSSKIEKLD